MVLHRPHASTPDGMAVAPTTQPLGDKYIVFYSPIYPAVVLAIIRGPPPVAH